MGKGLGKTKRIAAAVLAMVLVTGSLSGCQYSSLDEYLEALGLKDSKLDNPVYSSNEAIPEVTAASTTEMSLEIVEDLAESAANAATSYAEVRIDEVTIEDTSDSSAQDASADSKIYSKPAKGTVISKETDEEEAREREEIGLSDNGIENIKKSQEGLYAYERLTEAGKTLYVEMLVILQNLASDIIVSTTSDEAIEQVFEYVMADHPEIFYVDGYHYTNYTIDNVITKISFTGNYTYNKDQVEEKQLAVNEAVNKCLANAPSSEDDYYAIKYIYDYLISNTEYDIESPDNQNICSVFINGRSVCNGYSKAAQLLLNKLGIECTLVTGTVDTKNSKGIRHAWNLVKCNDAYYYIDVTWGDSSYQTTNGESADATKLPAVNYDYLNVTTADILRNHTISDTIDMPNCSSMADNYYVREDEYFTSAEMSLVKDLFDRRYKDGSNNVTIKCANQEVYDSMFSELITARKVFEYMQGDTASVSYTTFADTNTIIFWL
ncbi:MAG: hypothetical protein J6O61_11575 [Butyrivibrio sp.]|uniref:transglutaminase domain-containing protein n=1 Tax=Butyrivibrio sp. TaxID=28121 RepID=UPI001B2AD361|nr:transglutaminase domain-containing protein [Butyrivibrio sp.]MBO6241454.1 hypothetical protein [Butyrivibrio sp.]